MTTSNQKQLTEFIKSISGQANILTIPRIYIDITGDHLSALFLSQCIYWSDKGRDGWFYKSEKEWGDELGLSSFQVKRIRKDLEPFIETDLRKANGAPTIHYRVNMDSVTNAIVEKLNNPLLRNSTIDSEETQQSLTETTQKPQQSLAPETGARVRRTAATVKGNLLDGILANQPPADTIDLAWLEEYLRPRALVFWQETKIAPMPDERNYWRKELKAQYDAGITVEQMQKACQKMRHDCLTIKSPASIRSIAREIPIREETERMPTFY